MSLLTSTTQITPLPEPPPLKKGAILCSGRESDSSAPQQSGVVATIKNTLVEAGPKKILKYAVTGIAAYALYDVATSGSAPKIKK